MPSVHPLTGKELRALRRLQREQEPGRYVFMSERGEPFQHAAKADRAHGLRQARGLSGRLPALDVLNLTPTPHRHVGYG